MRIILLYIAKIVGLFLASTAVDGTKREPGATESTTTESGIQNTSLPLRNESLADFEPAKPTEHVTTVVICGKRPSKTERRLECERLHRENLNIARCPYSLPVTISNKVEQFETADDIQTVTVRLLIEARWQSSSVTVLKNSSSQGYSQDSSTGRTVPAPEYSQHNDTTPVIYDTKRKNHSSVLESDCGASDDSWTPQLFIPVSQSKDHHSFSSVDEDWNATEIDGVFVLSRRLSAKVWCKTSLWQYPFDTHLCVLYIAVFQSQNYSSKPFWDSSVNLDHEDERSHKHFHIPGFHITVHPHRGALVNYASIDNREAYSLPVVMNIRRHRWRHVLHVYLPTCLMVVVGWASFYIPNELAEGRALVSFLNVVGTIHMFHGLQRLPAAGSMKAIDIWFLAIVVFIWASVVGCVLDLDYAFRGIEREQHEAVSDVLFFYRQPKLARKMADTGRQEELERQRAAAAAEEESLIARFRRRRETLVRGTIGSEGKPQGDGDGDSSPSKLANRRKSRFDRRRQSTFVGTDLFFDAEADVENAAEDTRVEWSEFYQWAHQRHMSRHAIDDIEEEEEREGSLVSVQSLLENMWNIRKEYRWLMWADHVSKCVKIMYPVFFCMFLVVYCLVYIPERMEDIPEQ